MLEPARAGATRRRAPSRSASRSGRPAAAAHGAAAVRGPYGAAGPYLSDGQQYEVRLERVPGGIRLAAWSRGEIRREAPVLQAEDLEPLVRQAAERDALGRDGERLVASVVHAAAGQQAEVGAFGASPGRAGELRDELRVEALADGRVRVARWVMRPNFGWELQQAPVLLPAARLGEAFERAVAAGVVPSG